MIYMFLSVVNNYGKFNLIKLPSKKKYLNFTLYEKERISIRILSTRRKSVREKRV